MRRAKEPVSKGDRVVTDGSRFPPGIAVGNIVGDADAEVGFVLRGEVDPAARLSEIDFVKVIIGWSAIDAGLLDDVEPAGTETTSSTTSTTTSPTTTNAEDS